MHRCAFVLELVQGAPCVPGSCWLRLGAAGLATGSAAQRRGSGGTGNMKPRLTKQRRVSKGTSPGWRTALANREFKGAMSWGGPVNGETAGVHAVSILMHETGRPPRPQDAYGITATSPSAQTPGSSSPRTLVPTYHSCIFSLLLLRLPWAVSGGFVPGWLPVQRATHPCWRP